MFKLLTFYTLTLIIINYLYDIHVLNLHYLTMLCFIGGTYIALFKQFQMISLMNNKYEIKQQTYYWMNILFHVLPLLYVWYYIPKNKNNLILTYITVFLYIIICNPYKQYFIVTYKEKITITIFLSLMTYVFHQYYITINQDLIENSYNF